MTGHSKPQPWDWTWERCLASKVGLPRPLALVPCWEGSGQLRELVTGTTLQINGTATWGGSRGGGGLRCDANSEGANVVTPSRLRVPWPVSVMWQGTFVRNPNGGENPTLGGVSYDTGGATAPYWAYYLYVQGSGALGLAFGFGKGTAEFPFIASSVTPVSGDRFNVVGTNRNGEQRLYVNGCLKGTNNQTGNPTYASDSLLFVGDQPLARNSSSVTEGLVVVPAVLSPFQVCVLAANPFIYQIRATPAALWALLQSGIPGVYYRHIQQLLGIGG